MAFDFTTAIDYTVTIPMVRQLSLLVSNQTDAQIKDALEKHAVTRVAGYLMTAQDQAGNYIFYKALGDLADDILAEKVNELVYAVMAEPLVAGFIRRISAALACSYLLSGGAGSFVGSQEVLSTRLENQAMADLKHLIKSDIINKSIDTALNKIETLVPDRASIFFALDIDPSTISGDAGQPYSGAQDSGTITATVNGFAISAVIDIGDSPVVILNKIANAINAASGAGTVNVTVGPNEGPETTITRVTSVVDPFGVSRGGEVTYRTNLSSLDVYPFEYDKIVDVAVLTIQITNDTGGPNAEDSLGMPGIVYGVTNKPTDLSDKGPYSVGIDLKTGKTTPLDDPNKKLVSDALYFQNDDPTFGTLQDDTFKYRINGGAIQIVDIPANSLLHECVELLAQDLANKSRDQRVLGVVRPATKINVAGSPADAPGLSLVSVGLDKLYAKYVFTLVSSPSGIRFGVVPPSLISKNNFDEFTKSVIVNTNIGTAATYTQTHPDGTTALNKTGGAIAAPFNPSGNLKNILNLLNNPTGPLDTTNNGSAPPSTA